jgi:hypothetical protein
MDRFDDDTLFAELREIRPKPLPEFTAELDERAAAGFPRRSSRATNPFGRLLEAWRATTPRRRLIPVVSVALLVLAISTAIVATSGGGEGGSGDVAMMTSGTAATSGEAESSEGGGGEEAGEAISGPTTSNSVKGPGRAVHHSGNAAGGGNAAGAGGIPEYAPEAEETSTPHRAAGAGASETKESGAEAGAESAPVEEAEGTAHAGEVLPKEAPSGFGQRDIERSASIVLGTKPGEVAGAAAKVYQAVHAVNGVVLNSSVSSGRAGATGATFSLLIPSRKLDDALASFSQIAEVRSRHDGTNDITAPTVGATEELRDSNASIEGLLKELGDVETEAERESVEARLREERRHHAAIRASLEHLHKRASMSEVSLRIVTGRGAGVTPPSKGSGDWSVGDALHDAGHILTIAAGVVLIALAVLVPIALILLLVWLANRFRIRRLRERTLG